MICLELCMSTLLCNAIFDSTSHSRGGYVLEQFKCNWANCSIGQVQLHRLTFIIVRLCKCTPGMIFIR
jgi:hypothetical protein